MRATPQMQKIVTEIAARQGLDLERPVADTKISPRLLLALNGPEHLSIQVIEPGIVAVELVQESMDGDEAGRNVHFLIQDGAWIPFLGDASGPPCEIYGIVKDNPRRLEIRDELRQGDFARQCELWAELIERHGWLEKGSQALSL